MKLNNRILLSVLGLVGIVALVYVFAQRQSKPSVAADDVEAEVVPTGENVDPAIHSRMMTLKASADATPEDPAPRLELARFLQDAHRSAEAAEAYELALRLVPTERQAWLDLANAYGADGDWDKVVDASERMLERFPGDASALYNLGAAHANAGRSAAARAAWQAVASQDEDAALKAQAAESIARLDAGPLPSASATTAPPLQPGAESGPLPQGHPPVPSGEAGSGPPVSGIQSRVVSGGSATTDPQRVRESITE